MENYRVGIISQGDPLWVSYHDTLADCHQDVLRYGHKDDKVVIHFGYMTCDGVWEAGEEVLVFWVED